MQSNLIKEVFYSRSILLIIILSKKSSTAYLAAAIFNCIIVIDKTNPKTFQIVVIPNLHKILGNFLYIFALSFLYKRPTFVVCVITSYLKAKLP